MARQVAIPYVHESVVTSFDSTNSTYYAELSGYPADNGLGDGTGTYAGFNMTRGSNAVTYIYYNFDCSSIPDDATITSVSCYYRTSISSTNTNYINDARLQLCAGTTAKGTQTAKLTGTATYYTVDGGNSWTVAEVKNCKIRGYAKRGTRNTSSQYAIRMFGGTLTVNYTVNGMAYTITATSNVDGETIEPNTQEVYAGQAASVKINTTDLTSRTFTDNNVNKLNSLVYVAPDTGGTNTQYPEGYTIGGSGTISGVHYMTTIGCGVENPSNETAVDKTQTGGTTAIIYYTFNFSNIPETATITNMSVQVRYKVSNTTYAQSINTYSGTTAKGTAVTLTSTTDTTVSISSPGTWTAAQLRDDPRVGLTLSFSGAIITGVTWSVTYTANVPACYRYRLTNVQADHTLVYDEIVNTNKFYIKKSTGWVEVVAAYRKTNNGWEAQDLSTVCNTSTKYRQKGVV